MFNNHPIASNILSKAVLPFMLTLLLVGFFSCKKQVDLNKFIGTYSGEGCTYGPIEDTVPGIQFATTCNNAIVEVIVEPDNDDELRIVFNGVKDVKMESDLTFSDGDSLLGKFFGDSVYVLYYINEHNTKSFLGKRQ